MGRLTFHAFADLVAGVRKSMISWLMDFPLPVSSIFLNLIQQASNKKTALIAFYDDVPSFSAFLSSVFQRFREEPWCVENCVSSRRIGSHLLLWGGRGPQREWRPTTFGTKYFRPWVRTKIMKILPMNLPQAFFFAKKMVGVFFLGGDGTFFLKKNPGVNTAKVRTISRNISIFPVGLKCFQCC